MYIDSLASIVKMDARSAILVVGLFCLSAHPCRGFPSNMVDRIINGSNTNIRSAPYVLSFMLNDKYACCAAIISRHWAVTAAHCVKQAIDYAEEITVRSGSSILYKGGTLHRVTEIFIHENYNEFNNDYDIAVIKVTPPFIYNNRTKAVDLAPDDAEEISNEFGLVCGWGYYKKTYDIIDPILPERLQCVRLPIIKKNKCYQDYKFRYELTPRMTCYGFEDGEADSCKGDSGSPLVNENNVLLGITSWGDNCGGAHSPGVYTDTVSLRNWIKDNVKIS